MAVKDIMFEFIKSLRNGELFHNNIIALLDSVFASNENELNLENGAFNNLKTIFRSNYFKDNYSVHLKPSNVLTYFYFACCANKVYSLFQKNDPANMLIWTASTLYFCDKFSTKKGNDNNFNKFFNSLTITDGMLLAGTAYSSALDSPRFSFMVLGATLLFSFVYDNNRFINSFKNDFRTNRENNIENREEEQIHQGLAD